MPKAYPAMTSFAGLLGGDIMLHGDLSDNISTVIVTTFLCHPPGLTLAKACATDVSQTNSNFIMPVAFYHLGSKVVDATLTFPHTHTQRTANS
jgi:hypothetical protein